MLETFAAIIYKNYNNLESFSNNDVYSIPISWIILSLIISICTAYVAYNCNKKDTPATRFIATIFAFLFSGIYLIYYFIYHILLYYSCK